LLRSVLGWLRHVTPKLHYTNIAFYNGVKCQEEVMSRIVKTPSTPYYAARCWGQVLRFAPTLSFRGNRFSLHYSRVSQVFERQNARPDPEDFLLGLAANSVGQIELRGNALFDAGVV